MRKLSIVAITAVVMLFSAAATRAAWDPASFADEDVLELRTVEPGAAAHWSPVWLVVLDDDVYVRLGNRAARRMNANTTAPHVAVKVADEEFPTVLAQPAPEMAERVAAAMADKYATDILVRYFAHPLTMRLTAVPQP